MRLRSLLFVPGDSEKKFAKATGYGADALILDLEDSVATPNKSTARDHVASILAAGGERSWRCFVRINPLDTEFCLSDLVAAVKPGLDGVLVPKVNGAADIERIGHYIEALEARADMTPGTVKIAVVATETPRAMFGLGSYAPAHPRLVALTWGAEDLGAAIGATDNKEPSGAWTMPYQVARSQCLFAAAMAEVAPIETLYADFRDAEGLAADCRRSRRDGFTGRIAIHPDQVAVINECYSPSEADVAHARRVIAAFAANPAVGAVGIDGKMYDEPHLRAAKRVLASVQ